MTLEGALAQVISGRRPIEAAHLIAQVLNRRPWLVSWQLRRIAEELAAIEQPPRKPPALEGQLSLVGEICP